jgi:hypothetical protein
MTIITIITTITIIEASRRLGLPQHVAAGTSLLKFSTAVISIS